MAGPAAPAPAAVPDAAPDAAGPPIAWFGKTPRRGDFAARGLPDADRAALQDWLDRALGEARTGLGPGWEAAFDAAPPIRFWLGAALPGGGWCGAMVPSRDAVGRRYPLVALSAAGSVPPPLAPAQDLHDVLAARAAALAAGTEREDGPADEVAGAGPVDHLLWATHGAGATETLLSDIAAEEMARAAQARSYWWVAATPARVAACAGLPDGAVLAWLMTGGADRAEGEGEP